VIEYEPGAGIVVQCAAASLTFAPVIEQPPVQRLRNRYGATSPACPNALFGVSIATRRGSAPAVRTSSSAKSQYRIR
jgi:hypothetical protein